MLTYIFLSTFVNLTYIFLSALSMTKKCMSAFSILIIIFNDFSYIIDNFLILPLQFCHEIVLPPQKMSFILIFKLKIAQ